MELSAAIRDCLALYAAGGQPTVELERLAVKLILAELARRAPGHAVELRVPPYAAVQLVAGPRHRRGTPSSVVELSARYLIELAAGEADWNSARRAGKIEASGERADLSALFPL